jgi:hypothetical protein
MEGPRGFPLAAGRPLEGLVTGDSSLLINESA